MRLNRIEILLAILIILCLCSNLAGRINNEYLQKPASAFAIDRQTRTLSNISNWSYWVFHDGRNGPNPNYSAGGGIYPRGTNSVVWFDGLVWGGYVADNNPVNPRFGGCYFWSSLSPGWIENGKPVSEDNERVQIYRIRRDWASLYDPLDPDDNLEELRQDAAEFYQKYPEDVTESEMLIIWELYQDHWDNWPTDLGAPYYDLNNNGIYDPDEGEEPGLADADQVIWFVTNDQDSGLVFEKTGSVPMGLEIQTTIWSYNQPSATLGQIIFKKYKLLNISQFNFDSMYVAQWVDPDIGFYNDDFVGCDTSLSLGYGYNGFPSDRAFDVFNLPPPAVGYDFFQGPLIDGQPGEDRNKNGIDDAIDFGIFNLKRMGPGKINLPMTSFLYFSQGSEVPDPDWGAIGDYNVTLEWYNMLRGYLPTNDLQNPKFYTIGSGPDQGKPTKYPLSGDPLRRTGDIDGTGINIGPGDRRLGLSSGPFSMAPGDMQEVVVAIVGGVVSGAESDNVTSVERMKLNDEFAQIMYDNLFIAAPKPPSSPKVIGTELEDKIILNWGSNQNVVSATEQSSDLIFGYEFEGYNIYQLPNATATKDQAVLLATFDVMNGVKTIWGTKFDARYNKELLVPLQEGSDSGIKRFISIERDYITANPFFAGNTYYYAVTAYNYSSKNVVPEPTLESSLLPAIIVIPQSTTPGTRYLNEIGDEITATKSGNSTGSVDVAVIDPAALNDAGYLINFEPTPMYTVDESSGDTIGIWYPWMLINETAQETLLTNQQNLSGDGDYLIADGLLVQVMGPKIFGLNGWNYDGNRWISGRNWGGQEFFGGLDIGANFFGSTLGRADLVPVRMEFQDSSDVANNGYISKGAVYRRDLGYAYNGTGELPFVCYDVSNADNPRRLNLCFVESDSQDGAAANSIWDMGWNGAEFPGDHGAREYIYIMNSDYNEGINYNDTNNGTSSDVLFSIWPKNRGSRGFLLSEFTMNIYVNLPNTPQDFYTFSTQGAIKRDPELAKADVKKINVFPNPYYAYNPSEPDRFTRFVTITHLPQKATIRIFNFSGVQVRKMEKSDDTQFLKWDLKNESGFPVASGMYIAYIDMPELGKQKVLKIMVIQAVEIIDAF